MQPAMFLPHGAPDLAISDIPAAQFLATVLKKRSRPKGIVIISAHWETIGVSITTAPDLKTIHDFGGFGSALHKIQYAARTAPWLITAAKAALDNAGFKATEDARRGLDHGAWIPLRLMLSKADVPVVQISLDHTASPEQHFQLGQALAALADQDILVIGSGATVHNLRRIAPEGTLPPKWATDFDDWVENVLASQNWSELLRFSEHQPNVPSHPTAEHFLPLIVICGVCSARRSAVMRQLHRSYSYGSIGMAAWEVSDAT
ncbi:class III extradiol ring-cleavage dioxygenase [Cognatishimia sp. WU-CL00825]|uniref:DODA-type extradiol aromatic ring-opening family dioxygenase n=1 Tax=Cognatishimia sp. WU-CL00825 TaxID=3127658 RepID=UPI003105179D